MLQDVKVRKILSVEGPSHHSVPILILQDQPFLLIFIFNVIILFDFFLSLFFKDRGIVWKWVPLRSLNHEFFEWIILIFFLIKALLKKLDILDEGILVHYIVCKKISDREIFLSLLSLATHPGLYKITNKLVASLKVGVWNSSMCPQVLIDLLICEHQGHNILAFHDMTEVPGEVISFKRSSISPSAIKIGKECNHSFWHLW